MERRMCTRCLRVQPIQDFINSSGMGIVKGCLECRVKQKGRRDKRQVKKKALLASFNALHEQKPQLANYIYSDYPASPSATPGAASPSRPMLESSSWGTVVPDTISTTSGSTYSTPLCQIPRNAYYPRSPSYPKSRVPTMSNKVRRMTGSTHLGSQITGIISKSTLDTTNPAPSPSLSHCPPICLPTHDSDEEKIEQSADAPEFFKCFHCGIDRSVRLEYEGGLCVYCLEPKQEWCFKGRHEADEDRFKDEEGKHYMYCKKCRDGNKKNHDNEEEEEEEEEKEETGKEKEEGNKENSEDSD